MKLEIVNHETREYQTIKTEIDELQYSPNNNVNDIIISFDKERISKFIEDIAKSDMLLKIAIKKSKVKSNYYTFSINVDNVSFKVTQ